MRLYSGFLLLGVALSLAGCFGSRQQDAKEHIQRAEKLIAEGDTVKARVEFENALKIKSDDPQVNLALARLEDKAGDWAAAMPHYMRAAKPEAHLLEPQLRVAEIFADSDRLQDALGLINTTVGLFPANPDALAVRADIEQRQKQLPAAKNDADAALAKDPTNPLALAVLARLSLARADTAEALDYVAKGLAKHPDDLRLLQVQAAALVTANQPYKALEALRSIVRSTPRYTLAQIALAQLEEQTAGTDQAIASLRAATTADPTNADLQLAFVKFLADRRKSEDVISYLKRLIAEQPRTSVYDLALAGYDRSLGQFDASKDVLEAAGQRLGSDQQGLIVKVALAVLERGRGNLAAAQSILDSVLAADPQNADALLQQAGMQAQAGRTAEAVATYQAFLRQDPVNAQAYQGLATAYLVQGLPNLAVDAMKRAVAVMPGDTDAQLKLAAFLEHAGDRNAARELMTRLTLRDDELPSVWLANAQIAIDQKDWGTASRSIARLKEMPGKEMFVTGLEGQVLAARGDNAAAAAKYRDAIASRPDPDPSLIFAFQRASLAAGLADDSGRFLLKRAKEFKGTTADQAWISAMTLLARAGHLDLTDEAFQQAAGLSPQNAGLYTGYADLLMAANDEDKAKSIIARGLASGAPKGPLLMYQGWIAVKDGNLAAAEASYKSALAADPLSLDAASNYGSVLADGQPGNVAALTDIRNRLSGAERSKNAAVIDTMAWLDYRLKRFDEAKTLLTSVDASQSSDPQIRFHMAAVLLASGDRPKGLALLETLKGLDFVGADEARSLSAT